MDLLGAALTPLAGGFSGETFLAEAAGERSVVRIYANRGAQRGPAAPEIDAAVLGLVRGLLPVPEVREVRRPDTASATPGLLVTSHLPGERLDLLLPRAGREMRATIGSHLGDILAMLAQMPMPRAGMFADRDLSITGFPRGEDDLVEWVRGHAQRTTLAQWSQRDLTSLLKVADQAQRLLDRLDRACLVQSDFNPKNLLADSATGQITGLLDWEFAHAGAPFTDLGNLLRFEREPVFADAVLAAYVDVRNRISLEVPGELLDTRAALTMARACDLWALVELAGRRDDDPVASLAHAQLLAIARTGDLDAAAS